MKGVIRMKIFKKSSGMTFIEVMLTSAAVTILMLASLSLISHIYKGSATLSLKTVSFNLAAEQVEYLKHNGFSGLVITPDSCINDFYSPDITALGACTQNTFPVETVVQQNHNYLVYKIVMYAQEDPGTGNLMAIKQGALAGGTSHVKMMKVVVAYTEGSMAKQSVMTGVLSDKSVTMSGIKVTGRVADKVTPTKGLGPSHGTVVYVQGHPEYTTTDIDNTTGLYNIYNVLPGSYIITATIGDGTYTNGSFAGNPLVDSSTSGDIPSVDILCNTVTSACIKGFVTYNACVPIANATPEGNVMILASDGQSSMTTSNTSLGTNFLITNVNAGPSVAGQTITISFFQSAPGVPGAFTWVGTVNKSQTCSTPLNIGCVQLVAGTAKTGIAIFKTLSAIDRGSVISGVTINLDQKNAPLPIPTPYSGVTNGTGDLTFASIIPLTYGLTPTASNYIIEGAPLPDLTIFTGANPVKKIYLYPTGSISGIIRDSITTNPIPNIAVRVISNSGAGSIVSESFTDITGAYLAQKIPVGTDYMLKASLDGTIYTPAVPADGNINPVIVTQGVTTPNENFTLAVAYKTITGTVSMPNCNNESVLIIAAPSSNTQTPQSFVLTATGDFYNQQDNFVRIKYPYFGTITRSNGASAGFFTISVPSTQNVNIYAYYNYVSLTGDPKNPTRAYLKYFNTTSNVSPGSTITINGSWTAY